MWVKRYRCDFRFYSLKPKITNCLHLIYRIKNEYFLLPASGLIHIANIIEMALMLIYNITRLHRFIKFG